MHLPRHSTFKYYQEQQAGSRVEAMSPARYMVPVGLPAMGLIPDLACVEFHLRHCPCGHWPAIRSCTAVQHPEAGPAVHWWILH